jgi:hypothetical protein
MASLLMPGGPKSVPDKAAECQQEFDFNHSMNSSEDAALAEAIFGDDMSKELSEDASRRATMSERPVGKLVQMPAHKAQVADDPAHAIDSDGQEHSNTAAEKYSDSLQNLADLSNAAEFADHEKDHQGATSTHVQHQVGPFKHNSTSFMQSLPVHDHFL